MKELVKQHEKSMRNISVTYCLANQLKKIRENLKVINIHNVQSKSQNNQQNKSQSDKCGIPQKGFRVPENRFFCSSSTVYQSELIDKPLLLQTPHPLDARCRKNKMEMNREYLEVCCASRIWVEALTAEPCYELHESQYCPTNQNVTKFKTHDSSKRSSILERNLRKLLS